MMELLSLAVELLPGFAREHGSTLGAAGGGTLLGGTGVYFFLSGRINQLETLVIERFDRLNVDVKATASESSERDAYLEGKFDEAVRESRDGRSALHSRLDEVNRRLAYLEGKMNGRA